jgi:hypothetical protein
MKLALIASLLASASSLAPMATRAVKKGAAKAAGPPATGTPGPQSVALPFQRAPPTIGTGELTGDFGFDPLYFSQINISEYFAGLSSGWKELSNLQVYREAELMHGRIAQLAVVGFIWPGLFGTIPGYAAETNPLLAPDAVGPVALGQVFLFMSILEWKRIGYIREEGASYIPGDLRLGQGEGRFNPFNLDYTPEQYEEKKLQELKHCRLAMIAIAGLWLQATNSGEGVIDQLSAAFSVPEYYGKAGYFLPEGI